MIFDGIILISPIGIPSVAYDEIVPRTVPVGSQILNKTVMNTIQKTASKNN